MKIIKNYKNFIKYLENVQVLQQDKVKPNDQKFDDQKDLVIYDLEDDDIDPFKPVKLQDIKNMKYDLNKIFCPIQKGSKIRSTNLKWVDGALIVPKYEYKAYYDFSKHGWEATDDGLMKVINTNFREGRQMKEIGIRVVGTDPAQNAAFLYAYLGEYNRNGQPDPNAKDFRKIYFEELQGGFAHRLVVGEIDRTKDNVNQKTDPTGMTDVDVWGGTEDITRDKDYCSLGLLLGPETLNEERARTGLDKEKPPVPVLTVNMVMGENDANGNVPLYETTFVFFELTEEEQLEKSRKEKEEREARYEKQAEEARKKRQQQEEGGK
jgi:hypothetical protein